jgi:glycosyltransferase involved in cell wall biosynthesis
MMECIVSVAMATFNGEKHVIEQLESLARQTLMPVELIVTDDGSTDKTVDCPFWIWQKLPEGGFAF